MGNLNLNSWDFRKVPFPLNFSRFLENHFTVVMLDSKECRYQWYWQIIYQRQFQIPQLILIKYFLFFDAGYPFRMYCVFCKKLPMLFILSNFGVVNHTNGSWFVFRELVEKHRKGNFESRGEKRERTFRARAFTFIKCGVLYIYSMNFNGTSQQQYSKWKNIT